MNTTQRSFVSIGAIAMLAGAAASVQAADDHLQCYKIKDPLKLSALVNLNLPQFGMDPNCAVKKAKFFCVPGAKTLIAADDGGAPITPIEFVGPNAGDRICYKMKCPLPSYTVPAAGVRVGDQFATRILTGFKTQMLCTPALKVPPGWLGQFEFATPTPGHNGCQFWTDDDGVDPANAGCHYPYSDELCTAPVNGLFGEACEDADVLIETNPAAGVCHMHKLGVGHPDRFSCDAYCKGSGFAGGACVSIPDHCGVGVHSAECACS